MDSIDTIYWEDLELTLDSDGWVSSATDVDGNTVDRLNNLINVQTYLGDDTGNFSTYLEDAVDDWNTSHKMTNIVYAVVTVRYNRDNQVTSLADMRFVGTAPINDPADAVRDLLQNTRYGLGLPDSAIDTDSFDDATTYFSESVDHEDTSGNTVSAPRFQVNGALSVDPSIRQRIETILIGSNSSLRWSSGQYSMFVNKADTVQTFDMDLDKIIGSITVAELGMNDLVNKLVINYGRNEDNNYQRNTVVVETPTANRYSNEPDRERTLELPLVGTAVEAQRIGTIILNQAREQLTIQHRADITCLPLEAGDVITYTIADYGWDQKQFRIIKISEIEEDGRIEFEIEAIEYASSVYDDLTFIEPDAAPNTNLPSPAVIEAVDDLEIAEESPSGDPPNFLLEWTVPNNSLVEAFDVFANRVNTTFNDDNTIRIATRRHAGGTFTGGNLTSEDITALPAGEYSLWVVARNNFATSGPSNRVTIDWNPDTGSQTTPVIRLHENLSTNDPGAPTGDQGLGGGWYDPSGDFGSIPNDPDPHWEARGFAQDVPGTNRRERFTVTGTGGDVTVTTTEHNQEHTFTFSGTGGESEVTTAARPEITEFTFSGEAADVDIDQIGSSATFEVRWGGLPVVDSEDRILPNEDAGEDITLVFLGGSTGSSTGASYRLVIPDYNIDVSVDLPINSNARTGWQEAVATGLQAESSVTDIYTVSTEGNALVILEPMDEATHPAVDSFFAVYGPTSVSGFDLESDDLQMGTNGSKLSPVDFTFTPYDSEEYPSETNRLAVAGGGLVEHSSTEDAISSVSDFFNTYITGVSSSETVSNPYSGTVERVYEGNYRNSRNGVSGSSTPPRFSVAGPDGSFEPYGNFNYELGDQITIVVDSETAISSLIEGENYVLAQSDDNPNSPGVENWSALLLLEFVSGSTNLGTYEAVFEIIGERRGGWTFGSSNRFHYHIYSTDLVTQTLTVSTGRTYPTMNVGSHSGTFASTLISDIDHFTGNPHYTADPEGTDAISGSGTLTSYSISVDGTEVATGNFGDDDTSSDAAEEILSAFSGISSHTATRSDSVITATSMSNSGDDVTITITQGTNSTSGTSSNDLAVSRSVTQVGYAEDQVAGEDATVTLSIEGTSFAATDAAGDSSDDVASAVATLFNNRSEYTASASGSVVTVTNVDTGQDDTPSVSVDAGEDADGTAGTLAVATVVVEDGETDTTTTGTLASYTVTVGTTDISSADFEDAVSSNDAAEALASAINNNTTQYDATVTNNVITVESTFENSSPDISITVDAGEDADGTDGTLAISSTVLSAGSVAGLSFADTDWEYFLINQGVRVDDDTVEMDSDNNIMIRRGIIEDVTAIEYLSPPTDHDVAVPVDTADETLTTSTRSISWIITGTVHDFISYGSNTGADDRRRLGYFFEVSTDNTNWTAVGNSLNLVVDGSSVPSGLRGNTYPVATPLSEVITTLSSNTTYYTRVTRVIADDDNNTITGTAADAYAPSNYGSQILILEELVT